MSLIARARTALGAIPDPIQTGIADAIWNEREGIRLVERTVWEKEAEFDVLDSLMKQRVMLLPSGRRIAIEPTHYHGITTFTAFSSTGIPAVIDQKVGDVIMRAWTTAFAQAVAREIAPGHAICFATGPSKEGVTCLPALLAKAIDEAAPLRVHDVHTSLSSEIATRTMLRGEIQIINGSLRTQHKNTQNTFCIATNLVHHPRFGTLRFVDSSREVGTALKRAPMRAIADTFPAVGTIGLPSAPTGNARAAGILRLCAEAIAIDPDMSDPAGGRIAPLVHEHLPRLLKRHAEASVGAASSDLAQIDSDLDEGLELVRAGVERALESVRSEKRDALATELRFLRARHPSKRTSI